MLQQKFTDTSRALTNTHSNKQHIINTQLKPNSLSLLSAPVKYNWGDHHMATQWVWHQTCDQEAAGFTPALHAAASPRTRVCHIS